MEIRTQKTLLVISIAMMATWFLAFAVFMGIFPPPSPTLSTEEVVQIYATSTVKFQVGVILMIYAGLFMIPLSLVIYAQMIREDDGVNLLSVTQLIGGVITGIVIALPSLFWATAAYSVDRAPELTVMMHELAFLTFIVPVFATPFMNIPIAIISFRKKPQGFASAFPRWLGYLSLWVMLVVEVAPLAVIFKSGPFAWNGLFPFWLGLAGFGVLLGALFVALFKTLGSLEDRSTAAEIAC